MEGYLESLDLKTEETEHMRLLKSKWKSLTKSFTEQWIRRFR